MKNPHEESKREGYCRKCRSFTTNYNFRGKCSDCGTEVGEVFAKLENGGGREVNVKELKERFNLRLLDEKEIESLFFKVEEMKKALEWYADYGNWSYDRSGDGMLGDGGERARQALKGVETDGTHSDKI